MGEKNYDLLAQYEQDVKNLLFCIKNLIKDKEENNSLDLDFNNLKIYYNNLLETQKKRKQFQYFVENYWQELYNKK